jgi:peroxidase
MFCLLPLLLVFSEAQARGYRGQGYGTTTGGWDEDGYGPLAKGCAINVKQGLKTVCVTYEDINYYFWKAKGVYDLDGVLEVVLTWESTTPVLGYGSSASSGTKDAKYLSILGKVLEVTTKSLADKYGLDKAGIQQLLPQIDTMKTKINKFCPQYLKYQSCKDVVDSRYSKFDGSCNNIRNPSWGETFTAFKRFLLPDYSDNVSEVRAPKSGNPLDFANSRQICTAVHQDQKKDDYKVTSFFVAFGQVVIHDSMMFRSDRFDCCAKRSVNQLSEQCAATSLLKDYFYHSLHKQTCLGFTRSQPAVTCGCRLGPRQQLNRQTAALDASFIYSQHPEEMNRLRSMMDGKLIVETGGNTDTLTLCKTGATSKGILKCIDSDDDVQNTGEIVFDAPVGGCKGLTGDNRVNTTPGLYVETLIFVRLHNWITDQLLAAATSTTPNDEQLFQEARRITIAIYQHIVYSEWLPAFIGSTYMKMYHLYPLPMGRGYFTGYDPKEELGAYNVASAAALRVGHSMVHGIFSTVDPSTNKWTNKPLKEVLEKPFTECVDAVILGLLQQAAHKRGKSISDQLTNHLFQAEGMDFGADLCTININRGRDHGLPGYNKWRKWCGLSEIKTWNDAYKILDARVVDHYKNLYKHPDDIDLFSAGVSERVMEGVVGPTFGCIVARQFRNYKIADRYWYENKIRNVGFTVGQLNAIKSTQYSDLLCLLGDDLDKVQKYVMYLPRGSNFMRACPESSVMENKIQTAWKDFDFSIGPASTSYTTRTIFGGGWS